MIAEHYRQRASAGLLITEGSQISRQGQGYIQTPGVYSDAQVEGWRKVTDAVHQAGGRVFIQLWHVGRVSHVSLQPDGAAPVAPSAIRANTRTYLEGGFTEVSEPRALTLDEIAGRRRRLPRGVGQRQAGWLRRRRDPRGQRLSARPVPEGRLQQAHRRLWRFCGKPGAAHASGRGRRAQRLAQVPRGRRIAPVTPSNDVSDSDPIATFGYIARELDRRRIGYLHVVEGATGGARDIAPFNYRNLRKAFGGAYIANNGYTRRPRRADAAGGRRRSHCVRPSVHRQPRPGGQRCALGAELNAVDQSTLFGGGTKGYNDYPTLAV